MFPKRIESGLVELSKQISLLEVQCEKMDRAKPKNVPKGAKIVSNSPPVRDTNSNRCFRVETSEAKTESGRECFKASSRGSSATWSELLRQKMESDSGCDCQLRKSSEKSSKVNQGTLSKSPSRPSSRIGKFDSRSTSSAAENRRNEDFRVTKTNHEDPAICNRARKVKPKRKPATAKKQTSDKAVECQLESPPSTHSSQDISSPVNTLFFLVSQLTARSLDPESARLVAKMNETLRKWCAGTFKSYNHSIHPFPADKLADNDYVVHLRRSYWKSKAKCETLEMEHQRLTEISSLKDKQLQEVSKANIESKSVISELKNKLTQCEEMLAKQTRTVEELTSSRDKLRKQQLVAETEQLTHEKMQERLKKYILANNTLKTELRMEKLELQKLTALLSCREEQLKGYQSNGGMFQKQMLEAMAKSTPGKTNAKELPKRVLLQSPIGSSDLDLDRSDDRLVHSSPNSTKGTCLDSSWNKLSSIHGAGDQDLLVVTFSGGSIAGSVEDFGKQCDLGDRDVNMPAPTSIETGPLHQQSFTPCRSLEGLEEVVRTNTTKLKQNLESRFKELRMRWEDRLELRSLGTTLNDTFQLDEDED